MSEKGKFLRQISKLLDAIHDNGLILKPEDFTDSFVEWLIEAARDAPKPDNIIEFQTGEWNDAFRILAGKWGFWFKKYFAGLEVLDERAKSLEKRLSEDESSCPK
jgi:hypothetical protein